MDRRGAIGGIAGAIAGGLGGKAWGRGEPSRILVGQSAALSGPAGLLGQQFRQGAQLFFGTVNASGGIAGHPIELRTLDDGFEPDRCVENTRELIQAGAVALFGYVGTAQSLAALPLAADAQRLFIAPFTGSEALRIPYNPLAFHVRASYVDETHAIVEQIRSIGLKRIAVFYQNDGDGKAGLLGVTRALKLRYQSPCGIGFVERNSIQVDGAVRSILAGNPDAIVQVSPYGSSAAFVRAARRAGFGGIFYNTSLVGAQPLAKTLGPDVHGVVVSQVMPFPFAPLTVVAREYLDAGRRLMGVDFSPSYGSIEGYIAARTLVEGLHRAGRQPGAAGIAAGLESMGRFDLGGFDVDFGPGRHSGSHFTDLTILTEDGRIRT